MGARKELTTPAQAISSRTMNVLEWSIASCNSGGAVLNRAPVVKTRKATSVWCQLTTRRADNRDGKKYRRARLKSTQTRPIIRAMEEFNIFKH
eukprot:scaffold256_cov261-Pinguiococcus_pyrenoidosus.AAC.7